jgi:FixJ family two-component response regulator
MCPEPTIFVVDDDALARQSVCALAESMGVRAEAFASAEEFLNQYVEGREGCLVTDFRMPGMSGVELQEVLLQRRIFLPTIVLTAYARTPVTVRAVKAGAVAVLDKPCPDNDLWDAIRLALAKDAAERAKHAHRQAIVARLDQLNPVERLVLNMIVAGATNKAIAAELDVSVRTIENRRKDLFAKMQAESVAHLIRLVIESSADENHAANG